VSNWIVSRKYLLTAAQVFIGNQLFDYADIASSSYFTDAQHGLVAQFVTSMKLADHDIMLLNYAQLPSLQSVTLLFGGDILDDLEDVDPWKDDLEKKHLEIVAKSKHLLRLSGLQEFHIQLTDTMHLIDEPNASQKAKLSENMQKLEVFLPPLALRSKTQNDPYNRLKTYLPQYCRCTRTSSNHCFGSAIPRIQSQTRVATLSRDRRLAHEQQHRYQ
jgi:hypothetical protein